MLAVLFTALAALMLHPMRQSAAGVEPWLTRRLAEYQYQMTLGRVARYVPAR
jgi:hypothetical protein